MCYKEGHNLTECATAMVLGIAKLTLMAEYTYGILHWLGNRTYRPGIYSVILPKLTPAEYQTRIWRCIG